MLETIHKVHLEYDKDADLFCATYELTVKVDDQGYHPYMNGGLLMDNIFDYTWGKFDNLTQLRSGRATFMNKDYAALEAAIVNLTQTIESQIEVLRVRYVTLKELPQTREWSAIY